MNMKTEMLKIIEGGLDRNKDKVQSYAGLMAQKSREAGEVKFAERIENLLTQKSTHPVYLDEFVSKPVDQDSRLDMVDVYIPSTTQTDELILPRLTSEKISNYIDSLAHRGKFIELGVSLPESLLLFGPPGCGKTSIARYISQRTGLPLVTARLDSLVSSLLGNTAKNIRRIFDYAKQKPCILFLDEFDAIAKARDDTHEIGELKRVVNSLLQNIDDFNANNILIAATNHEKLLDPAVWRRFSNIVEVPKPQKEDIKDIVRHFESSGTFSFVNDTRKMNQLAEALFGFSPSDIKVICYNSIKRSVIVGDASVSYPMFVHQIYLYQGITEEKKPLVNYLFENGVSRVDISKHLGESLRQINKFFID